MCVIFFVIWLVENVVAEWVACWILDPEVQVHFQFTFLCSVLCVVSSAIFLGFDVRIRYSIIRVTCWLLDANVLVSLLFFVFLRIAPLRAGPCYKRCRMRVPLPAGRFETSRGEVRRESDSNISTRPLADLSLAYVALSLILLRERGNLVPEGS